VTVAAVLASDEYCLRNTRFSGRRPPRGPPPRRCAALRRRRLAPQALPPPNAPLCRRRRVMHECLRLHPQDEAAESRWPDSARTAHSERPKQSSNPTVRVSEGCCCCPGKVVVAAGRQQHHPRAALLLRCSSAAPVAKPSRISAAQHAVMDACASPRPSTPVLRARGDATPPSYAHTPPATPGARRTPAADGVTCAVCLSPVRPVSANSRRVHAAACCQSRAGRLTSPVQWHTHEQPETRAVRDMLQPHVRARAARQAHLCSQTHGSRARGGARAQA
jgi:hypothetical protein